MFVSGLLNSGPIPVLEQVMAFTEARHEVLVNNLANIDTPFYRMQDLSERDFSERLQEAIERRRPGGAVSASPGYSDYADPMDPGFEAVAATRQNVVFHDENNRSVERQVVELTKNGMRHNAAAQILTAQFRLLETAISERV